MLIILLINIHFQFDISIILFTSFFSILLIDRFNLCSRRSVPPFHKFLPDFGICNCPSSRYRFYFSHNFLVIMIFLRIWLLLFQSRHPTGFIKLPVTIIHLIITTVIFSCQIVHSVLFVGYILPFNYSFVNKFFVFFQYIFVLSVNFTNELSDAF